MLSDNAINPSKVSIKIDHLRIIESILSSNRKAFRKSILPTYKNQLLKYKTNSKDIEKTQNEILKIEALYQEEKSNIKKKDEILKITKSQLNLINTKIQNEKNEVEKKLILVEKKLEAVEQSIVNEKEKNENEINAIKRKLRHLNYMIDKLYKEGTTNLNE